MFNFGEAYSDSRDFGIDFGIVLLMFLFYFFMLFYWTACYCDLLF